MEIRYFLRNVKQFQKLICFFSGRILRACPSYNIARLSTLKLYAFDQTAGHGLE